MTKIKDERGANKEYSEGKTALIIAGMVQDLIDQVGAETCLVVATNLLAKAWCEYYNNKVPVEGQDFDVANLRVSIFPKLSEEDVIRIENARAEEQNNDTTKAESKNS